MDSTPKVPGESRPPAFPRSHPLPPRSCRPSNAHIAQQSQGWGLGVVCGLRLARNLLKETLLIISGSWSKESGTWKPASFIACQPVERRKPRIPHATARTMKAERRWPCSLLQQSPCRREPLTAWSTRTKHDQGLVTMRLAWAPACPNCTCSTTTGRTSYGKQGAGPP